jgi:hypothetical protein
MDVKSRMACNKNKKAALRLNPLKKKSSLAAAFAFLA